MKAIIIVLTFCLFLFSFGNAQTLKSEEKEILHLQNQRVVGNTQLHRYLHHNDEQVRWRALIAIANIEDTTALDEVYRCLMDEKEHIRATAAFTISYIAPPFYADTLLKLLLKENSTSVQSALMEAIGFLGDEKVLEELTDLNIQDLKQELLEPLALCYARLAQRGIKSERSIWQCFDMLQYPDPSLQAKALYALWRSAPYGVIDVEVAKNEELLTLLTLEQNYQVRMHLAQLLARVQGMYRKAILDSLESNEIKYHNDWRVLVQIVKARAAQIVSDKGNVQRLANYIHHFNLCVQLTALQSLAQIPVTIILESGLADAIGKDLLAIVNDSSSYSEVIRGEALLTLGSLFPAFFDTKDSVFALFNNQYLQRKRLEALAQSVSQKHLDTLISYLQHPQIRIAMSAWDYTRNLLTLQALRVMQYDSARAVQLFRLICDYAENSLKRNDIALTTIIADIGSTPATAWLFSQPGDRRRMMSAFIRAFESLSSVEGAEAKLRILKTLRFIGDSTCLPFVEKVIKSSNDRLQREAKMVYQSITGVEPKIVSQPAKSIHKEIDWKQFESLPARPRIEFETTKGKFTIELFKNETPLTTTSFVQLVQKNFYNNLTFHRVVPGFVIQGGDPRGDGWGGPGYVLRTEIFPLPFDEGVCGMANAGKDSEGSQFFITQVPSYHLDGRYTAFGRVLSGMEVIHSIMIGDTIISARVLK